MPKYKEIVAKVEVKPEITLADLLKHMMTTNVKQQANEKATDDTKTKTEK